MKNKNIIDKLNNYQKITFFSFFASTGTILCCALPALLVAVGAGASLSSFLGAFPEIIWISQYKEYVFLFAFTFIFIAGMAQLEARNFPCPANKEMAKKCNKSRKISLYVYLFSVMLLSISFIVTFLFPMLAKG